MPQCRGDESYYNLTVALRDKRDHVCTLAISHLYSKIMPPKEHSFVQSADNVP